MPQSRPVTQALLAAIGATLVALITSRFNTSPTLSLVGAALAAAVPVLISAGTPRGITIGIAVTAAALAVTYLGFTAADPETFPGSEKLRERIGVQPPPPPAPTPGPTERVNVPDVVGKPYAEAADMVEDAGLKAERKDVELSDHPQGVVVDQNPDAGESLEKGSSVELSVTPLQVPDVRGQTEANARSQLAAFSVEVNTTEVSDPAQDGLVLEQSLVGTMAAPGATVEVTIGQLQMP
jgi:hypothetical protein